MRQNADARGIEGATMTGDEMKAIRFKIGLTIYELASLLRYRDFDGLIKMESGSKRLTGPVQLCMEMLDDGRLDPVKEFGVPKELRDGCTCFEKEFQYCPVHDVGG